MAAYLSAFRCAVEEEHEPADSPHEIESLLDGQSPIQGVPPPHGTPRTSRHDVMKWYESVRISALADSGTTMRKMVPVHDHAHGRWGTGWGVVRASGFAGMPRGSLGIQPNSCQCVRHRRTPKMATLPVRQLVKRRLNGSRRPGGRLRVQSCSVPWNDDRTPIACQGSAQSKPRP